MEFPQAKTFPPAIVKDRNGFLCREIERNHPVLVQQPTGALYDLLQRFLLSYMFHPYPYFAQIIVLLGRKNGRVTVVYGPTRALEENLSKTTLLLNLFNWRSFTDTKDEETSWIEFFLFLESDDCLIFVIADVGGLKKEISMFSHKEI